MSDPTVKPLQEHVLIINDDGGRRELLLTEPFYTIGRSSQADIRLRSQFVSRIHAVLVRKSNEDVNAAYRIIDGDHEGHPSVNGLMVNGKKRQEHTMEHGDEVVMGPQVCVCYEFRRRDRFATLPGDDEYDITLIDPGMIEDEDNLPTSLSDQGP